MTILLRLFAPLALVNVRQLLLKLFATSLEVLWQFLWVNILLRSISDSGIFITLLMLLRFVEERVRVVCLRLC